MADLKVVLSTILEAKEKESADKIISQLPKIEQLVNSKSKVKLMIDIAPAQLQSQVQAAINNAQSSAKSKAINLNVGLDSSSVEKVRSELSSLGVDANITKEFTDQLGNMGIQIDKVRAQFVEVEDEENRLLQLQIQGTDQLNRSVSVMQRYNTESQEVETVITGITTNYAKQRDEQEKLAAQVASDYQKRLDFISKEEIALNKLQAIYTGESSVKPVKNNSNLDDLKKDYDALLQQLEKLKNANTAFSEEEVRNINKSISALSDKIKKYQNLEYVATSLRTKSVDQVNAEQLQELNEYEEKLKSSGLLTTDFQSKISDLRNTLSTAFDSSSITAYLDEFGKLKGEVDALREKLSTVSKIYTQLINVSNKITSTQIQIKQLESGGDSNLLSEKRNELALYEKQQSALNAQLSTYNDIIGLSGQKVKYEQQSEVNQQKIRNATAQIADDYQEQASSMSVFAEQINRARSNLEAFGKTNSALFKNDTYSTKYNTLLSQLNDIKSPDELRKWNAELSTFKNNVKTSGLATLSFGDTMKNAFSKFSYWLSVTAIIMSAIRAIKEMVTNVVELDTAMTELKKVTDEVDAVYNNFLDKAAEKAKKIGTTMTDYVNATSDFARLGYSLGDAEYLAEVATIYSVVGDDISSIDDATSSIISTMKAFNIEASNSMTIIDKFNEVGNKFAISSGGIGDALTRSAAALNAAGNSIDESIALIVAANNVIQDPDVVGTMWKTVAMRIRGAKTELEEAGLETEGIAVSTSKLRDAIMGITNINGLGGFDILTDTGAFKSTYDIIQGIGKVWKEIGETDPVGQAALLELLAGKRQGNALAAALTNVSEAEKVLKTSLNSAGSALSEHEKWLESVAAKTKHFQAAWESLSSAMIDSGSISFVVDSGTVLLSIIEKLVKSLGGLQGILVIVAGVIATINAESFLKLPSMISSLVKNIVLLIPNLSTAIGLFIEGRASGLAFGDALKMAGVSASTAQIAFGALTAVLSVAIIVIQSCIQKHDEMIRAAISAADALEEETQQLDDYKKRIIELRNDLDSGNKSYEDAKSIREELYNIQDELIGQYGSEAAAIDTVTDSIESQVEAIDKLGESSWRKYVQENQKAIQESIEFFDKQPYGTLFKFQEYYQLNNSGENPIGWVLDKNALQENNEFIAILKDELSDISNLDLGDAERYFETITQNVTPKEELEILREVFDTIEKVAKERYGADYLDYVSNILGAVSDDISKIQEEIDTKAPAYDTYIEGLVKYESEFSSIYNNILTNKQKLDAAYSSNNLEQITNAYQELLKSLDDAYDASSNSTSDYANDILSYFKGLFPNIEKEYEDFINSSVKSGEKISDANADTIATYSNIIKALKSVQTEASKTGKVSSSTYQKVIALGEDFAGLFEYSEGQFTLSQEALEKYIKSLNDDYAATLASNGATDEQISVLDLLSRSLFATSNSYEDIIEDIDSLSGILEKVNSGYEYSALEILDLIYKYPELAATIEETTDGYKLQESAVLKLIEAKAKFLAMPDSEAVISSRGTLLDSAGNQRTIDNIDKIFDSYKAKYEKAISSWDEFVIGWEDYWQKSADGVNWVDGVKDYVEAMINQTNVTEWADKIITDMQNGVIKQGKSGSSSSSKSEDPQWLTDFKAAYDEWNHLVDMGEKTQAEYINWLDGAYKSAFANDTAKKYISDMWKYEEEVYKDRQSIAEDSLKATQDNIDEYIEHIDEMYKKHQDESVYIQDLSNALQDYGNVLSDTQRANILSKISAAQSDYYDNLIKDIEHEIDLLERESGTEQERISLYEKAQEVLLDKKKYYQELGYSETSDELQQLENKYNKFADNIVDIMRNAAQDILDAQKRSLENAGDALDTVLDKVVEYIKREKEDQIAALKSEKDTINEYYDEQQDIIENHYKEIEDTAKDSYDKQVDDTEEYYQSSLDNLKESLDNEKNAIKEYYDDVINKAKESYEVEKKSLNDYYDELSEKTKKTYEETKESLTSYYSSYIESIKNAHDAEIKALEDRKDKYKELIDLKKESLQVAKEEEDYNREVEEKNKHITSIQSQLDALQFDDSNSARARRQKLEEELAEAKLDLTGYQAEYSLDKQLDALDKEYELYAEKIDKEIDLLNERHDIVIDQYETEKELRIAGIEEAHEKEIQSIEDEKETKLQELEDEHDALITSLEEQRDIQLEHLEKEYNNNVKLIEDMRDVKLQALEDEHNASLQNLEDEKNLKLSALETEKAIKLQNLEDEIAAIELALKKEGNLRREANARLAAEGKDLWDKIIEYEYEYSENISDIEDAWNVATSAVDLYNNGQMDVLSTLAQISQSLAIVTKQSQDLANALSNAGEMSSNISGYQTASATIDPISEYHDGAENGYILSKKSTLKSNEIYAKLAAGELVLTPEQLNRLAQSMYMAGEASDTSETNNIYKEISKDDFTNYLSGKNAIIDMEKFISSGFGLNMIPTIPNGLQKINKATAINSAKTNSSIQIDRLFDVTVNGNMTEEVLALTKKQLQEAADYTINKLNSTLTRTGRNASTAKIL